MRVKPLVFSHRYRMIIMMATFAQRQTSRKEGARLAFQVKSLRIRDKSCHPQPDTSCHSSWKPQRLRNKSHWSNLNCHDNRTDHQRPCNHLTPSVKLNSIHFGNSFGTSESCYQPHSVRIPTGVPTGIPIAFSISLGQEVPRVGASTAPRCPSRSPLSPPSN